MLLRDSLVIRRSPEEVAAGLHNPATLAAILPACTGVAETGPGRFKARVERKFGLLNLRAEPDVTLTPAPEGLDLTIEASGMMWGRAGVALRITLAAAPVGTRLTYAGEVTASGLAKRLLLEKQTALGPRVRMVFVALKGRLERGTA